LGFSIQFIEGVSHLIIFKVSMKNLLALFALLLFSTLLYGQDGNEWIAHDQLYAKIPVAKDGIYHLSDSLLQAVGFPTSVDPRKLQLFHRGKEQPLIVAGQEDGVFHTDDYIEFFGQRNDGTLDTKLYEQPNYQPHLYYNIFNDTTSYFLTVGTTNGKRIDVINETDNGYPAYSYHLNKQIKVLSTSYSDGKDYGEIIKSSFDQGEGFMGTRLLQNQSEVYTLNNIKRGLSSVSKPLLEVLVTGRGPMTHIAEVYVGASPRLIASVTVDGFASQIISKEIEWADVDSNGDLQVKVLVKISSATSARLSVNYVAITFPQELDMNSSSDYLFTLPANGSSKSVIQIANASNKTRLFDITDAGEVSEINAVYDGTVKAVVPSLNSIRKVLAANQVIKPSMKVARFREINPAEHNYVIISHRSLRKPGGTFADPVKAYAEYRASVPGGEYDTLVVNIDDLYDQFSYGEQTPLAIFNFLKFLSSVRMPEYLFLIGKGLDVNYNYFRQPATWVHYKNLIPSAGMPASDAAFSVGLDGTSYRPSIPTGRISAMHPAQVAAYLKKVIEKEISGFTDIRKKNILHLSGGIYSGEPQLFRSYLEEYEGIAQGLYLGGKVDAIAKQSTDIKLLNISEEVNNGLNLITFFGHSSPGSIDFDIGYVTDVILGYNNKGKYPMLLMNGCQSGAFQLYSTNPNKAPVFGEDWINASDRGAVGFIAHSSFGFVHLLRRYSKIFYEVAFGDSVYLSKGVGDVQREVATRFLENITPDEADITQVQQMMLLGDPAVSLFGAKVPDYSIKDENISLTSLDENPVTSFSDSFAINFIVRNYGQARDKPLQVQVKRTYGDRLSITYDSVYSPLLYADTLTFIVRGENKDFFGNNTLEIRIDANNEVTELDESNNVGYLDFFLPLNGTQNLYPRKFSIVNEQGLSLTFQHTDILSAERNFLVEFDTVNTFDSPFRQTFSTTATVLARQPITLLEDDSLVYYWRTKIADPLEFESQEWTVSSFTYINNGPDGWSQSHFPQFMENVVTGLVRDPEIRLMQFDETKTSVSIRNYGMNAGKPLDSISFKINGEEFHLRQQGFGCRNSTINLVAFDKISTAPYIGVVFNWATRAGRTCGREPWVINSFRYNELVTGNNDDLIQYVDNVSSGDSLILFTIGNAGFSNWPAAAKQKLAEVGISESQINALSDGEPVVILARKNSVPGSAIVIRSGDPQPLTARLLTKPGITGRSGFGKMTSALIGPAEAWHNLHISLKDVENSDNASLDVIGIRLNGQSETLLQDVTGDISIADISAETYPMLRLVLNLVDTTNLTASQLKNWTVTYEPVAEGLIIYQGIRTQEAMAEGVVWEGKFGFINVSDRDFHSALPVQYKVLNHESLAVESQVLSIDPPASGDTTLFTVPVNTFNKVGLNDIEVIVNPNVHPEQLYENNVFSLVKHLNVIDEIFNPVLDVTVDGRYIENDEFVSSTPEIAIRIWDENSFLLKKDTLGVNIFMAYPCGEDELCIYRKIYFSDANVTWKAATDSTDFIVEYDSPHLEDGRYLLSVEAIDESGNGSGTTPYEVAFQVRSDSYVDLGRPYPNPTSGTIQLSLDLAGESLPEQATMRLISTSGTVLGVMQLSHFHHGHNKIEINLNDFTQYKLSPGIYIYEISLQTAKTLVSQKGKLLVTP
jgi:hypothetical protein